MEHNLDASSAALRNVVGQLEKAAAVVGWDRPPALYALAPTAEMLEAGDMPPEVLEDLRATWDGSSTHLSAILQETLAEESLEDMLLQLSWPEAVFGAAVSAERVMVPAEVEAGAPSDPEEALEYIGNHPDRSEVRLTVGVTRPGQSWCEIRFRDHDSEDQVLKGTDLVPTLVQALQMGFLADEDVVGPRDS